MTTNILERMLGAEERLLERLIQDYNLEPAEIAMIVRGLGWFKETYRLYLLLWNSSKDTLESVEQAVAKRIFDPIKYSLYRDSLSCFSNTNFFGKIRFMLYVCARLGVDQEKRQTYLGWVLDFPQTEEKDVRGLFENDLFPANLPHVYMHMTAGFVRQRLLLRLTHRKIVGQYRTFQKELRTRSAHARWFEKRLPGSYGSRQ